MIPINIEIKIQDDLIKEFIIYIYITLEIQNHESKKQSLSYSKTLDIELLTIKDVSKPLKTDEPTIRRLIYKGFLRILKLGRLKIRKTEIERFLEWAEGKDFTDLDDVKELY